MDFFVSLYPWFKAIHIIAVISWMAGLFYLPRLFVYHCERAQAGSESSETFKIMEQKLLKVIMNPAMITSWIFGILMILTGAMNWLSIWFLMKFLAVMMMSGFHGWCAARVRDFSLDKNMRSGRYYRFMNEVPTLLMIFIVVMVVIKPFS